MGPGATVGIPSYCVWARTRVVILNYALKSRAAGPLRSGVHFAGPAAPDLLSARGRVWWCHVSQRRQRPTQIAGGPRTPHAIRTPGARGTSISPRRGPEPPRVHGHGHESSAGRLAHPPHLMRWAEACSVAAEHGAAFAGLYYWSRITKVNSAVAGAARAVHVSLPH